jgi:diacylglycerol kinase (ATP)
MAHFGETFARLSAYPLRGGVGRDQLGVRLLNRGQLSHESVVLGVGDFGLIEDIVEMLVPPQLFAEIFDLLADLLSSCHLAIIIYREASIPVYRKAVLIYNPVAGKLKAGGGRLVEQVLHTLSRAGHGVTPRPTPGPDAGAAMARESISAGADLILAFGGDGTINEVAEGVVGSRTPFGILPGGTANVLCRELGIGASARATAAHISEWRPERIAAGLACCDSTSPRHFLAMAGIGFDAHIVYRMSAELKKKWGKLAYWISGFSQLVRDLEEFDVEVDGQDHRCSFALVTKVRNYGGDLQIARNVSILDDEFEIILFAGKRSTRYLKYLTGVAVNQLAGLTGVTLVRARQARFRGGVDELVYMQIDGEYAGRLPGQVQIAPDALTLLVPVEYAGRRA